MEHEEKKKQYESCAAGLESNRSKLEQVGSLSMSLQQLKSVDMERWYLWSVVGLCWSMHRLMLLCRR